MTKMSKFVSAMSKMVVKDCHIAIIVTNMDIYYLVVHAQQIKVENLI